MLKIIKIRSYEMGLHFRDGEFMGLLREGQYWFFDPLGKVRVEGIPVHLSKTDWVIERAAPCLGEHNEVVFGELLGHTEHELRALRDEGVL